MAYAATSTAKPPLDWGIRIKLSVMMFLQFATWGAWFAIIYNYLEKLNPKEFTDDVIGQIIGTMALGTIFAPLFVGQVADRFFSSEKLMAILHIVGAGLLYWMAQIDHPALFYAVALVYALVYSPTLALSNSIAFAHVPDAARDFPSIRVMGTIGWIVANLVVGQLLTLKNDVGQVLLPNAQFLLAATFSWILGVFSLMLPHTPPPGKAGDALPFLKALGLFKDYSFAVFFGVSFVITIVLAFYYGPPGAFLEYSVGYEPATVPNILSIGQGAELILLPFLPWFLKRFGMKWVLAVGMFCWGVRYALFSLYAAADVQALFPIVLVGVALHGVCFDFFFAAGFIHVDNEAPADIRGSAQALFTFLTYGVGMWLGNILAGELGARLTDANKVKNWAMFWLVPSVGVFLCLAVFLLFFRNAGKPKKAA
jgi:nucleoside transporter